MSAESQQVRTLTPEQVRALLYELCVDLGFCSLGDGFDQLVNSPPNSIDAFTDAVFRFEGLSPQYSRRLRRSVHERVTKHFEAADLDQSSIDPATGAARSHYRADGTTVN